MRNRASLILRWSLLAFLFGAPAALGQLPGFGSSAISSPTALRTKENQIWHVFGRVTTLNGEPASQCLVRVQVANQSAELQALKHISDEPEDSLGKSVKTNVQGEFQADFSLDPNLYPNLEVNVTVQKSGYPTAHETVDFGSGNKTWSINLILPEKRQGADEMSLGELSSLVGARLRGLAPKAGRAEKEFREGAGLLLDQHDARRALPRLAAAVKRDPSCVSCALLHGLAMLEDGSWAGGEKEFADAAHLNDAAKPADRRPEPWILLGVLESWRHEDKKAAGFFSEALKIAPQDPLALQELGRTQVKLKNWEPAEQYLAQALKAGAPREARLLRIEALLGEGVLEEADLEMTAYLGGRDIRQLSPAARALYSDLHNRMELKSYGTVKSYVRQPVPQLTKAVPELEGLEAASDQSQLPALLAKVGEQVAGFFKSFPNTISLEQVRQERVRAGGKTSASSPQKFNYLLLATAASNGLGLEEYRTDAAGTRAAPQGLEDGFMLTAGFASASLFFHPEYQAGAQFRLLGQQTLSGHGTLVVAFAQRPETARLLERFNTNDASVLILVQGVAWVDSSTYRIVRLRTDLLKPADKIRLERQTTQITYGEFHFKDNPNSYWLPREVVVTVDWKGKTFRNLHEYSDFRLFNVESTEKRKSV